MKEYQLFIDFDNLNKLVDDRDIDFIRETKDLLVCWDFLSIHFPFTTDELREFKDYINWSYLDRNNYTPKQLKEWFWIDDERIYYEYLV